MASTEKQAADSVSLMDARSRNNHLAGVQAERFLPEAQTGFYQSAFNLAVLIAGLGYFIDTYDFFLYNSMRVVSLTELGLSGDLLTKMGILILNCQILGALVGSFVWGVLGDKLGRKGLAWLHPHLFPRHACQRFCARSRNLWPCRFITGFGVAGEVGLGATLIAETVGPSKRTFALMFFTIMGVLGVTAQARASS